MSSSGKQEDRPHGLSIASSGHVSEDNEVDHRLFEGVHHFGEDREGFGEPRPQQLAIGPAIEERPSRVRGRTGDRDPRLAHKRLSLGEVPRDGQACPLSGLKVKVIRNGGSAFRSVIEEEEIRGELGGQIEQKLETSRQRLRDVLAMNDCHMLRKNGVRIAHDHVFPPIGNPSLLAGKVLRAKGARTLAHGSLIHDSGRTRQAERIMLKTDERRSKRYVPHEHARECLHALGESGPVLALLTKERIQTDTPSEAFFIERLSELLFAEEVILPCSRHMHAG